MTFSPAARQALESHSWPGNIRELRNAVERALLFTSGPEVSPADMGLSGLSQTTPSQPEVAFTADNLNLDNLERWAIMAALEQSDWVQSRAAKLLGISPRGLVYKLQKHAISHPRLEARKRRK
ncbi:MAG: hypothetical protein JRJ59_11275 [Deltaproteobacteria bacterium]|nr:hypothetical protein [Deltaproteobacteria bacterium]